MVTGNMASILEVDDNMGHTFIQVCFMCIVYLNGVCCWNVGTGSEIGRSIFGNATGLRWTPFTWFHEARIN